MKKLSRKAGLWLFSAVIASQAAGESATRVLQPRGYNPAAQNYGAQRTAPGVPLKKPVRRVASVSDKSYEKLRVKKSGYHLDPDRETDMRFFLAGGISGMSSGDADMQTFRDEQKLGSNYLVGLGADVRFQRYFGAELDAYYGIAPTQTIVFDDEETQKKKIQHMGAMFNVKAQYPTYVSDVRVTPKLGVGYGMLKLNQSTESQLFSETVESSETVKGIYGTVGFDVEPIHWLIFTFDYATSLMGSGSFSVKSNSINGDTELTDAKFDRIRLGVFVRVHPNVLVGGNYTKRSMKFSPDDDASSGAGSLVDISNQESLSQIAGTVMFQF